MGLAWGWHGPHGVWHGVSTGLAWGWHGVSMGLAWGRMGLAWGWHGVGMGLAWGWHGVYQLIAIASRLFGLLANLLAIE
jgi:hypothetical protein